MSYLDQYIAWPWDSDTLFLELRVVKASKILLGGLWGVLWFYIFSKN